MIFALIWSLLSFVVTPANAIGPLYDPVTESGDVACSPSGFFSISNNAVASTSNCVGSASVPDGVLAIGAFAFQSSSQITSIVLPESVQMIGAFAFSNMENLESITISAGSQLNSIGRLAFQRTPKLTSIFIPASVASIDPEAFLDANGLRSITVAELNSNFSSDAGGVLFNKSKTTLLAYPAAKTGSTYSFPDGVTSLGANAFGSYEDPRTSPLTNLILPNGLLTIGDNAFKGATSLNSLVIPNSVTSLGSGALAGTTSLSSLTLPGNLATDSLFSSIPSLSSITFNSVSNSYRFIDGVLFNTALTKLIRYPANKSGNPYRVPDLVEEIADGAFSGASLLTSINIPSSVTTIGENAFLNATTLTTVTFAPNSALSNIYTGAFKNTTSLASFSIPGGVTFLADYAFDGSAITNFYFLGNAPGVANEYPFAGLISQVPKAFKTVDATGFNGNDFFGLVFDDSYSPIIPGTPTIGTATAINANSARITFNAPDPNDGPPITSYRATSVPGGLTGTLSGASSGTITVSDLNPETSYTFTVVAINAVGISGESSPSNEITTPRLAPAVVSLSRPLARPDPYLKTLTAPKMNVKDGKLVCTSGTYTAGWILNGVIQGSPAAMYSPASYTYNLLINGFVQTPLAITSPTSSIVWEMQQAPSGSVISCAVTAGFNSLTNTDRSNSNTPTIITAMTTQAQSIATAESIYSAAASLNFKIYQAAIVDNRVKWRKEIEASRNAYYEELDRINSLGISKSTNLLKSAALKSYIAAQKKIAADYQVSQPIALAAKDAANRAALQVKMDTIVQANATYGAYIESIGYGVLIP